MAFTLHWLSLVAEWKLRSANGARAALTFEERRDSMIWDWVQNNRNQTSVSFSEAVRRALGVGGAFRDPEEHGLLDETAIEYMKADVLKIYNQTQAWFRERGVTHLKLRRGVRGLEEKPSTLRSFTNSSKVAREFGNAGEYHVLIPVEQVLLHYEAEGWVNGVYGEQFEFLVMPKIPGGGRGRQRFVPKEELEQMQKERHNWHAFD